MRTPKRLYPEERLIYHPELLTCPNCGDILVTCNSLAWDKTVQRLDRVLSVASRPGHCPHATCVDSRLRLLSAEGQGLAPAGSTYGYDVVVHIGWWRQEARATYREIHAALAPHRQRFRLQSRSLRQTQAQFNQLRQQWSTLQPTGTG